MKFIVYARRRAPVTTGKVQMPAESEQDDLLD